MGLFDALSGIFRSGVDAVTDFGGGAFAAVDERLRGGRLSTGVAASGARTFGAAVGNLFGDIGESFLKSNVPAVRTVGGTAPVVVPLPQPPPTRSGRVGAVARAPATPSELGPPTGTFTGGDVAEFITALPGGAPIQQASAFGALPAIGGAIARAAPRVGRQLPGLLGGLLAGEAIETAVEGASMSQRQLTSISGRATLSPMSAAGVRLPQQISFMVPTPSGGSRIASYRNMGTPILWSGDLAAVRRVSRVATKTRQRLGRRGR